MLSWAFFGTARALIGFAEVFFSLAPVLLLLWWGLMVGVGVVLFEELVVVVMQVWLVVPVVLMPEVAGTVGGACVELEAAMVALGVGMVLDLDVGMGTVLPVIVTVKWELESQRDCADQALFSQWVEWQQF